MKQLILIAFTVSILTIACSKTDFDFSGNYVGKRTELSEMHMYVKGKEITDKPQIKKYLETKPNAYFIDDLTMELELHKTAAVEFLENKKANVTYNSQTELRKVIDLDEYFYFETADTITLFSPFDSEFTDFLYLHKPAFAQTVQVPNSSGFKRATKMLHCYYSQPTETGLEIPLLSYFYSKNTNTITSYEYRFLTNNAFNKSVLTRLETGDTLVIQEGKYVLEKN